MKKIVLIALVMVLTGCVPIVHVRQKSPGSIAVTLTDFDPLGVMSSLGPRGYAVVMVYFGWVPQLPISIASLAVSTATLPIQYPIAYLSTKQWSVPNWKKGNYEPSDQPSNTDTSLDIEVYESVIKSLESIVEKKKANQQDCSLEQKEVDRLKKRIDRFKEHAKSLEGNKE